MPSRSVEMSRNLEKRLCYLESVTLWEGRLNRQRLCKTFDISPNQITKDFSFYRKKLKGAITYDVDLRAYSPAPGFKPVIASGKATEYLALLRAELESGISTDLLAGRGEADTVLMPTHAVESSTLMAITRSVAQKRGLSIAYQSTLREAAVERKLWPVAFVFSGFRWHVRCYDGLRRRYGDFVLTRIVSAKQIDESLPADAPYDVAWNEIVTIRVIPHHKLSAAMKKVVAREYGMENTDFGPQWIARMRRCLAPYFLILHRLGESHSTPKAHMALIKLADANDAKRYWFRREDFDAEG